MKTLVLLSHRIAKATNYAATFSTAQKHNYFCDNGLHGIITENKNEKCQFLKNVSI